MNTETTTACIRTLNDALRLLSTGGELFVTRGIAGLLKTEQAAILDRVRTFDDFSEDNDPWHEHDFGSFDVQWSDDQLEDRLLRSRLALPLA